MYNGIPSEKIQYDMLWFRYVKNKTKQALVVENAKYKTQGYEIKNTFLLLLIRWEDVDYGVEYQS